ncbi:MAG: hypothetical protein QOF21_1137 [Actinomycetota bacterium]
MIKGFRRWREEWRPSSVTLGGATFPLLVLFGLNAVDELDRAAFGVLLPDIRDHFDLTNKQALAMVSVSVIAVLLIEIPLSFYADRGRRVRIAAIGAALWGIFSIGTGLAITVAMLVLMRIGAGGGRAVVTPTHNSLLSDYYAPEARVKVFSFHRQANSVGLILGPLIGGGLGTWLGWRAPFFVFAVPTFIFVVLALRLEEPVRGMHERLAAGVAAEHASIAEPHESVVSTIKVLYQVRTIRRIWMAMPFLAIALVGIAFLLSLVYQEVFGLNAAERGVIAAAVEPLQIVGIFVAIPIVSRIALRDPGFLLRFVALVGIFNGFVLVALAYAPHVSIAIMCHMLLSGSIGTLAPAFFATISIVAPARVRSVSFSAISVFGIPGIALLLPIIGAIADEYGAQKAMIVMIPVMIICGFILASAAKFVADDIATANAHHAAVPA